MRLPFARIAFASAAACLVLSNARAQDINVDVGAAFGTPTPAYGAGAGAGMAGAWNSLTSPTGPYAAAGLLNTGGAATPVGVSNTGGFGDFSFNNAGTIGDDQALMDDLQDIGGVGGSATWTFTGLTNGTYDVYTYAWAPDSGTFLANVTVPGSSSSNPQGCGGAWPGAQTLGITYTKHTVVVASGTVSITVATVSGFASINGFQLDLQGGAPISAFCFGDNTGTMCPCAPGTTGRGCSNSSGFGALLTATGTNDVSNNNLTLTCANMMPGSFCIFRQGTATLGGGLGVLSPGTDGLDCVGGTTVRLGRIGTLGGTASISNIVVQGGVPPAGGLRHYQAIYRNQTSYCTPATLNGSNGLSVNWVP